MLMESANFLARRDHTESMNEVLKTVLGQDESPVSITDSAFTSAEKDKVKCTIVFHSPTKEKYVSSCTTNIQKPSDMMLQNLAAHKARSPRRRASTSDNIDCNRSLNRSISIKDATLLALACRGGGYGCDDSPGGVVVDEESRQLILKGQYFTPQKNKRRGEMNTSLGQYTLSEEDKRLLELATKHHLSSPKSNCKANLKESPFKQFHDDSSTPNGHSFYSASAGKNVYIRMRSYFVS
jgi:hypothetical protein